MTVHWFFIQLYALNILLMFRNLEWQRHCSADVWQLTDLRVCSFWVVFVHMRLPLLFCMPAIVHIILFILFSAYFIS